MSEAFLMFRFCLGDGSGWKGLLGFSLVLQFQVEENHEEDHQEHKQIAQGQQPDFGSFIGLGYMVKATRFGDRPLYRNREGRCGVFWPIHQEYTDEVCF